jgi:hypothetical protein
MDVAICFDPFRGGPGLHWDYFDVVAIVYVTQHYIGVSLAGSDRELSLQVVVELTLIDDYCVHELGIAAQVCIRLFLFLSWRFRG